MSKVYRRVFLLIGVFFLLAFVFLLGKYSSVIDNKTGLSKTSTVLTSKKEDSLRTFFEKEISYENSKDDASLYELFLPEEKAKISKNEYINKKNSLPRYYSRETTYQSASIDGDYAFVDFDYVACWTKSCVGDDRISGKGVRKYVYYEGGWYLPENSDARFCRRVFPYQNPEEFNRAVGLMIQRLEGGSEDDRIFAIRIQSIENCLNIKYANSESDMYGAEGLFKFSENSSMGNYTILVSPRYSVKDDLLTSVLLMHEIVHAVFYADGTYQRISCFENEASAFSLQYNYLIWLLNEGERQSLVYRAYKDDELHSTLLTLQNIMDSAGNNFYESALSYLKNNPYYIDQCSNAGY